MSQQSVFDRTLLRQRCRRARQMEDKTGKNYSFLAQKSLDELCTRLLDVQRNFPACIQIGTSPPLQNPELYKIDRLWTMDGNAGHLIGDEELLPFGNETLDLVLAPLTLHSINDLPGMLIQLRRALKPDGLFLGAMLGGETLYELRDVMAAAEQDVTGGLSPRVFPFADKQQMGGLMQRAGFALPVVDSDIIHVTYKSFYDLCHDLRGMGESNIIAQRRRSFTPRRLFERAAELYSERYSAEDGRIEASFEIIYLSGWAPHENQQQPLRPGSAEQNLADHLGTYEHSAGEKVC